MATSKANAGKPATTPNAPANIPAPENAIDPDMPEGADEVDDGDVDELLTLKEGESVTGVYGGSKQCKSAFVGKKSTLHKFTVDGGSAVGVWGSHQLDQKLARVSVGDSVWVKYVGKELIGNGNTLHKYRVAKVNDLPF